MHLLMQIIPHKVNTSQGALKIVNPLEIHYLHWQNHRNKVNIFFIFIGKNLCFSALKCGFAICYNFCVDGLKVDDVKHLSLGLSSVNIGTSDYMCNAVFLRSRCSLNAGSKFFHRTARTYGSNDNPLKFAAEGTKYIFYTLNLAWGGRGRKFKSCHSDQRPRALRFRSFFVIF